MVTQIEAAFKRIREIASAGHFGLTVQSQNMLKTLGAGQEQLRLVMRQDSIVLRLHLKLEVKEEVHAVFDSFDRNWISRFEQIMIQSAADRRQASLPATGARAAIEDGQNAIGVPTLPSIAATEYADSMTGQQPMTRESGHPLDENR